MPHQREPTRRAASLEHITFAHAHRRHRTLPLILHSIPNQTETRSGPRLPGRDWFGVQTESAFMKPATAIMIGQFK